MYLSYSQVFSAKLILIGLEVLALRRQMVKRAWTTEELALVIYFASYRVRGFPLEWMFYWKLCPQAPAVQEDIEEKIDEISAKEGLQDESMAWKRDKVGKYIRSLGITEEDLIKLVNLEKDDKETIE